MYMGVYLASNELYDKLDVILFYSEIIMWSVMFGCVYCY